MDFDISQIAVPFRMQPGLRRLERGARHLTALAAGSALRSEKQGALQSGTARLAVPGFDPTPALAAIAAQARQEGLPVPGDTLPLQLAFEEDFAVLDAATGTLPWLAVCVPSHWAPEDKLGLPFAAVHAPVADDAVLLAAADSLVQLVTAGEHWERFVWTLTPSGRYDQHPRRHPREPWPDAGDVDAFAARCFLRAERQTFFPVGQGTRQAVFTIRVMLQPLVEAVDTKAKAQRLHEALASMSEATLDYKSLRPAQAPLLRWLAKRTG
jgi:hypothetical protein